MNLRVEFRKGIPHSQKLIIITWDYSRVLGFGRHDLSPTEEFKFKRMDSY